MSRNRIEASFSNEDLMAFARREMANSPAGNSLAWRIDAPLRSAYCDEYLQEKREADSISFSDVSIEGSRDALFLSLLEEIYVAERRIAQSFSDLNAGGVSGRWDGLNDHARRSAFNIGKLERMLFNLEKRSSETPIETVLPFIDSLRDILKSGDQSAAEDARLVAAVQAIKDFKLDRYDALRNLASDLGLEALADDLARILAEEMLAGPLTIQGGGVERDGKSMRGA